jgi:hypothetical protein
MLIWPHYCSTGTTYCIVLKTTVVASIYACNDNRREGGSERCQMLGVAIEVHLFFFILPLSFHCCIAVSAQ